MERRDFVRVSSVALAGSLAGIHTYAGLLEAEPITLVEQSPIDRFFAKSVEYFRDYSRIPRMLRTNLSTDLVEYKDVSKNGTLVPMAAGEYLVPLDRWRKTDAVIPWESFGSESDVHTQMAMMVLADDLDEFLMAVLDMDFNEITAESISGYLDHVVFASRSAFTSNIVGNEVRTVADPVSGVCMTMETRPYDDKSVFCSWSLLYGLLIRPFDVA